MGNIEHRVAQTLINLGVTPGLLGYGYLKTAIKRVYDNPDEINSMTKGLYPCIAAEVGTTPSRVERAIRHAIEKCFNTTDDGAIREVFGNTIDRHTGKVTNTAFICTVAEKLHIEDYEEVGDDAVQHESAS